VKIHINLYSSKQQIITKTGCKSFETGWGWAEGNVQKSNKAWTCKLYAYINTQTCIMHTHTHTKCTHLYKIHIPQSTLTLNCVLSSWQYKWESYFVIQFISKAWHACSPPLPVCDLQGQVGMAQCLSFSCPLTRFAATKPVVADVNSVWRFLRTQR